MDVRRGTHDDCVEAVYCEHLLGCGTGVRNVEIGGNLARLVQAARLYGNQFGLRMPLERGDVSGSSPPSGPDHSNFYLIHRFPPIHVQPLRDTRNLASGHVTGRMSDVRCTLYGAIVCEFMPVAGAG